jgi:hypothetical protein
MLNFGIAADTPVDLQKKPSRPNHVSETGGLKLQCFYTRLKIFKI